MGIFRTNDPTQYDDIDGIIIDETAPPPSISGVAANIAILVAQFERGPEGLVEVTSDPELKELYGGATSSGMKQLKNKRFGRLKISRAVASDAAASTLSHDAKVQFDALYKGAYGDNLSVVVEAGTAQGSKYIFNDGNPKAQVVQEIYDNLLIDEITPATFAGSKLMKVTVLDAGSGEPAALAETNLASGSDGTLADTDYETAIGYLAVEKAGNVVFLDEYNATRNGYLKTHAADTQDKMVIVCGAPGDDRATAIADVVNYRDADGRIIYSWPYVNTTIDGAQELVPPASFYASVISQTSPHIAPSYTQNTQYLSGITSLEYEESRNGYIALDAAGISAMELDRDVGFLIKNAVVTQIINSSKITVLRRRMADFLTNSIGFYLKAYQNDVNSREKRDEVKSSIVAFDDGLILEKILPGAQDVKGGSPRLVDTESENTDESIAQGKFIILYKRRIFSSMRYIVLKAEIGESVVVTEQEG
jgi:hypothetical protein